MPIKGIMLDAETGGLDPRTDAVTSLGLVSFTIEDDGVFAIRGTRNIGVIPHEEARVCLKSLKIQGYTSWSDFAEDYTPAKKFRGYPPVAESETLKFLTDFANMHLFDGQPMFMEAHKHIWAWNAPFDYAFLREMASRVPGTAGVFPYRPCWNDAKSLFEIAANTGLLEGARDTSLKTVAASMDIEHTPHDALSDCLAAVEVLARVWKALRGRE